MTNEIKASETLGPYDETFTVRKQRWGTYVSCLVAEDRELITSLTLEICVAATRFYLKGLQEGWGDSADGARKYDGVVGGKL
jgi:uncharacterized membrane protein